MIEPTKSPQMLKAEAASAPRVTLLSLAQRKWAREGGKQEEISLLSCIKDSILKQRIASTSDYDELKSPTHGPPEPADIPEETPHEVADSEEENAEDLIQM